MVCDGLAGRTAVTSSENSLGGVSDLLSVVADTGEIKLTMPLVSWCVLSRGLVTTLSGSGTLNGAFSPRSSLISDCLVSVAIGRFLTGSCSIVMMIYVHEQNRIA